MCGIFGINLSADSQISSKKVKKIVNKTFLLSERRGKDASGVLSVYQDKIDILKSPVRASLLLKSKEYKEFLNNALDSYNQGCGFSFSGHTRMVTSGSEKLDDNNQPIIKNGAALIHNGIIVNEVKLLEEHKDISKKFEVDSEILLSLFKKNLSNGLDVLGAFQNSLKLVIGANTFALFNEIDNYIYLHSSNKSLYFFYDSNIGISIFSSERNVLKAALKYIYEDPIKIDSALIIHAKRDVIYTIDTKTCEFKMIDFKSKHPIKEQKKQLNQKRINNLNINLKYKSTKIISNKYAEIENNLKIDDSTINSLKRCSKCVLPETFPHIHFDDNGVCNYCHNYEKFKILGKDRLIQDCAAWKSKKHLNDVLVPLSGGRDSCFGLHYVKNELGLDPIAYTYDWGFVTDQARRNISRICGEMNVEHVLIAADIRTKRNNVKKNVVAWLSNPEISLVPLFLAGDKFFYKYASLLKKEMNLSAIIFSLHALEVTNFKTGFANVNESSRQEKLTGISNLNKLKLSTHYLINFLKNPRYINSTIPDTFMAFLYYYIKGRDYYSIFDYIPWNENEIISVIKENYGWEGSADGELTWRIGDGTAPFYNYIYLRHSGFCENDTFRSNQIREGLISRCEAINFLKKDNMIDLKAYKWYCDTIGINAADALNSINNAFSINRY